MPLSAASTRNLHGHSQTYIREQKESRAMVDSLSNTSRAGGMATKGTEEDPHLIAVSGDGAGLCSRSRRKTSSIGCFTKRGAKLRIIQF